MCFKFEHGFMDDGTLWVLPPSNNLFHINPLTLRIVLELNSGASVAGVQKKYALTSNEIVDVLNKFEAEHAVVAPRQGRICAHYKKPEIWLTPYILLLLALSIIQIEYFKIAAATYVLRSFTDAIIIGIAALLVVFFHEMGHYLACRNYFKPSFGFTFLSIFPAVYVDTQYAWCLPRTVRILINGGGLLADMLVNSAAIALVAFYRPLEYFVTPFLMLQFTRLTVVLNPLFTGDGYWLLSDITRSVNLTDKGLENLRGLRLNLYSLFGLLTLAITAFSAAGLIWYLFNLSWKFLIYVKIYAPYVLNLIPS
jgi:hypothetical protein